MATKTRKKTSKKSVSVKLTEQQVKAIEAAFGKEFAKRAKSVKVTFIEGYGLSELIVN